jgi:ferric-dicitrate binding protein FerR (iron transport regulator)
VNRYSTRKLRLADASLASLPVAGNFIAGDSELVLSAFEAALPLRSVDTGGMEILLFRRYEPDPL